MLVPNDSHEPLFMRLRRRLHWWQVHATPQVVRVIRHGLPADWVFPPPHRQFPHVARSQQEVQDALKLMEEYLGVHAVRLRSGAVPNLLSWFVVYKPKPRFILNCIPVNRCLRPPPYFRLHNWSTIFPFLVKGHWAMKIDLKHAYFHLGLEPGLEDLLNFQIGSQVFQCRSACFGLHYLPFLWTQVMKTFTRRWRALGIVCFIYLDDILIFGLSKAYLNKMRPVVLRDLQDAGLVINFTKSLL